MILYTPKDFNENEWFILISCVSILLLLWLIPKRLHFVQILSIWLFNIYIAHVVDYSVIGSPINLYYSNDYKKYEIFDFLLYYFLYPSSVFLFLNGLATKDFLRKHWFFYVSCAAVVTTVLEKIAELMGVFTYIHWSIWYSLIAYIPLYAINVLLYHFVSKHADSFRKKID